MQQLNILDSSLIFVVHVYFLFPFVVFSGLRKNQSLLSLQASEDAKKLVNQERSFACAEIESARAVVQRFGEALEEEERISQTSGKQVKIELFDLSMHICKGMHTISI